MIALKTERLKLRHLQLKDASAFYLYRSDAAANKYQGWIPKTEQDALDFIKYRIVDLPDMPDTWIQLAIIHIMDEKIIGDIGVYFLPDEPGTVNLGYTLAKEYRGHGYATEALRILIDHLMIHFNKTRFVALISPENTASIRLVTRLGFKHQDMDKHPGLRDDSFPDDHLYILDIIGE